MHWLLAVFFTTLVSIISISERASITSTTIAQTTANQQATQTVAYINSVNDYLYQHPQSEGVVSDDQLFVKAPPGAKNVIQDSRVYVYQPDKIGLLWELTHASSTSALIGRVEAGHLIDVSGTNMGVSVPGVIPDGYIVYLN